jgi:hypothetical protein
MTQAQETMLRKIYNNADDATRSEMEEVYPSLFKKLYEFNGVLIIDRNYGKEGQSPFIIAYGLAPNRSLQNRCLMVNSAFYTAEMFEFNGNQFIKLIRKN